MRREALLREEPRPGLCRWSRPGVRWLSMGGETGSARDPQEELRRGFVAFYPQLLVGAAEALRRKADPLDCLLLAAPGHAGDAVQFVPSDRETPREAAFQSAASDSQTSAPSQSKA